MVMHQPNGFSLLEAIVAVGVLLFGVVTLLSLNTTSLVGETVVTSELQASNLAREALEVVRSQRDSNWLAMDSSTTSGVVWNSGLVGTGNDYTAVVSVDPAALALLDFTPHAHHDTCVGAASATYDCTAVWRDPTTGLLIQGGEDIAPLFDPSTMEQQDFSRLVFLYPICRSSVDEQNEQIITSGSCGVGTQQVGIDVVVEIQYPARGTTGTMTLEEHLYDWK